MLSAVSVGSKADKLSPGHGGALSMSWISVTGPVFPPWNPAEWAVQVGRRKERPSCQLPLPWLSTPVGPILHANLTNCIPRSHDEPGRVYMVRGG